MPKLVLERLAWMISGIAVFIAITSVIRLVEYQSLNNYQRETREFAAEIIKLERESESLQNMTFLDDLCFRVYGSTLQTRTRAYLQRMGAHRITQRGYK